MGAKHERPAAAEPIVVRVPVAARGQQLFQQAMAPPAPPPSAPPASSYISARRSALHSHGGLDFHSRTLVVHALVADPSFTLHTHFAIP